MNLLAKKKTEIKGLCEKFHAQRLYIHCSVVTGTLRGKSDMDFLMRFKPFGRYHYFDNYMDFKNQLRVLFQRKVDLAEEQTIPSPNMMKSINRNKKLIYGLNDLLNSTE